MARVLVSAEAGQELVEAMAWYEERSPGLGAALVDAFENAVNLLAGKSPPLTPMSGVAGQRGAKRLLLHRFPFSIVAIEKKNTLIIVALAHHARRPGYWKDRLSE
jgi:toxin ParE1/3/4